MSCKFNPIAPTKHIPNPKEWCNIRWGYCQWAKESDYYISYCPLSMCNGTWLDYWITGQKNGNKVVLVKIGDAEPVEMTIAELQYAYVRGAHISGINIDYDGHQPQPGPDPEKDLSKLIHAAMIDGYLTIYDENKLISLGAKAFFGEDTRTSMTEINIKDCLYIGRDAFLGCDNLVTVSFIGKTDKFIPVLDDIYAFRTTGGTIPSSLKIIVPSALYDKWIKEPNWVGLKSHITKG